MVPGNSQNDTLDAEDILSDSLSFLGSAPVIDDRTVQYGSITLSIAPKEGKANTLLADHLFSPALLLAEHIERGLLPLKDLCGIFFLGLPFTVFLKELTNRDLVAELGAGAALPTILSTTLEHSAPALAVATDYPDEGILKNLSRNIEANQHLVVSGSRLLSAGYEWGLNPERILRLLPEGKDKYDVIILSDLLHFHDAHAVLVSSITLIVAKSYNARAYVAAGRYTSKSICANFVEVAREAGLILEEQDIGMDVEGSEEAQWLGSLRVSGLSKSDLSARKRMCRWWIGKWANDS